MSEDVRSSNGLIGPNAILQMVPVLDQVVGRARREELLTNAGLWALPDGTQMIAERDAARLHRQVRQEEPVLAPFIAKRAGIATARYILKHRIPRAAQMLLKALPMGVSAKLLSQAIARHAWTFAGSGQFHVIDPFRFEIADNPLIAGERSSHGLCHWHAAVFAHLYSELVADGMTCEEVTCAAQGGRLCLFHLIPARDTKTSEQSMMQIKAALEDAP